MISFGLREHYNTRHEGDSRDGSPAWANGGGGGGGEGGGGQANDIGCDGMCFTGKTWDSCRQHPILPLPLSFCQPIPSYQYLPNPLSTSLTRIVRNHVPSSRKMTCTTGTCSIFDSDAASMWTRTGTYSGAAEHSWGALVIQ